MSAVLLPAPSPIAALCVEPLTGAIGAVVHGVDLAGRLTERELCDLRAAIHRHRVVFLRGQHLSLEEHRHLGERLGPVAVSPLHRLIGSDRTVSTIEDDAERPPAGFDWHTDLSWTATPPSLGILSALEIPAVGGDTLWASLPAALAALPAHVQQSCRDLRAEHAADASLLRSVERHHGPEVAIRLRRANPPVSHPLVRTHPVTGEAVLYLSPLYLQHLIGLQRRQGDRMLRELNGLLDDPHLQVRWRWEAGDVAIWDEVATCHRALTDHFPQRRAMRRCVVEGDRPRSILGTSVDRDGHRPLRRRVAPPACWVASPFGSAPESDAYPRVERTEERHPCPQSRTSR